MPGFALLVASIAFGTDAAFAQASAAAPEDQGRQAVERSIPFLQKEGVRWMTERKCASCHHVPMMIWSLSEAKKQGYAVDDAALKEVTTWTLGGLDNLVAAKILPDPTKPPDPRPEVSGLNLGAVFASLAGQAAASLEPAEREGLQRLAAYIAAKQAADGTWSTAPGGRPPIFEGAEITTLLSYVSLAPQPPSDKNQDAPKSEGRQKAADWLRKTPTSGSHQAAVLRLLLQLRDGKSTDELAPQIEKLLSLQNLDGGWSQTKEMPSDAFATGQTLYVLSLAGIKADRPEIQRAIAFLVSAQSADGSWPMTSRPTPAGGVAKDLSPITYAGTAWATLGLVRSVPK